MSTAKASITETIGYPCFSAKFAKSQSVRDIRNGLRSATGNLNHLGIQKTPSKSTVSYQNKHRPWSLFKDYYFCCLITMGTCRTMSTSPMVKQRTRSKKSENRHPVILKDEVIQLGNTASLNKYPKRLRRVTVQFTWTSNTIEKLYKSRWQIEIFFREIKQ